jgi:hypothetical protein
MSLSPEEIVARLPEGDDPRDVLADLLTHNGSTTTRRNHRERNPRP